VATIRNIAERAGVSVAAVSLALNGKPGVGDETRQRVRRIAEELGYRLPAASTSRQQQKQGTVRFLKVSQHGHTVNRDHNVFIADYIDGLSEVALHQSYNLEIRPSDGEEVDDLVASLRDPTISGAVILGTELTFDQIRRFEQLHTPLVFLDTYFPYLPFDFVDMDNHDAVYKAIREFALHGHHEVGIVTSPVAVENFRLRDRGFREACKTLEVSAGVRIEVDSTYNGALDDMGLYLDSGEPVPPALFCANDMIAYGCIEALRRSGRRVPQDVSVIGFDNLPQSERLTPPLTTIDVRKHTMGSMAMQLLTERIDAGPSIPARKVVIGAELISRKSVSDPEKGSHRGRRSVSARPAHDTA
jgi:LacI family transcriptional regulator